MKKLIIAFVLGFGMIHTQTIKTHATQYFYFYQDSTKDNNGECYFNVTISTDTVYLQLTPPMILLVSETNPVEKYLDGQKIKIWAKDEEGIGCVVNLFISPTQNEVHIVYQNVELAYILE